MRLIDMVTRTCRTILRISPPLRVPSPGEAHNGSGSNQPPSQAINDEDVQMEIVLRHRFHLTVIEFGKNSCNLRAK